MLASGFQITAVFPSLVHIGVFQPQELSYLELNITHRFGLCFCFHSPQSDLDTGCGS